MAVEPTYEEMSAFSFELNGGSFGDYTKSQFESDSEELDAQTWRVVKKDDRYKGFIIRVPSDISDLADAVDGISHESAHVAYMLMEDLYEEKTGIETNGHIVGYVAGKVMESILEYKKAYEKDPMDGATGDPKGALGEKGGEDATTNGEEDATTNGKEDAAAPNS